MVARKHAFLLVFASIAVSIFAVNKLNSYRKTTPAFPPTPAPVEENIQEITKDWKTYSNIAYKISFKFPSEYALTESPAKDMLSAGPDITMSFQLYPKPRTMSLDSAIRDGLGTRFDNYFTIMIDGIRVIHEVPRVEGDKDFLYVDRDDAVLVVETTFAKDKYDSNIFSKIIKTAHLLI